jgi:hypothetical protein
VTEDLREEEEVPKSSDGIRDAYEATLVDTFADECDGINRLRLEIQTNN